jgi:hypothetical protein
MREWFPVDPANGASFLKVTFPSGYASLRSDKKGARPNATTKNAMPGMKERVGGFMLSIFDYDFLNTAYSGA